MNRLPNPTGPLHVDVFALGPFETNAWVLAPPVGDVTVVDPGMDPAPLLDWLEERGRRVARVVLTHGHLDHVAGASALVRRHACPVFLHPADLFLLRGLVDQGAWYGFALEPAPEAVEALADGRILPLGLGDLVVMHTPGHSPGGVCLAFRDDQGPALLCGDTLFQGAFGRVDLPGGSWEALRGSVIGKIFPLPDETRLLPGHGPASTVGVERRDNPILGFDGRLA